MTTRHPYFHLTPEMEKAKEKADKRAVRVKSSPDAVRFWPAFVIAIMVLGFIVLAVI